MIYGFAAGEFQFMDSSVFGYWSDRDDTPVSARNYAHEVFSQDDTEYSVENILDHLDDYFGVGEWHIEKGNDYLSGSYAENYAVANDTVTMWPFIVRRRIVLIEKYYGSGGWTERPYPVPVQTDWEELTEPIVTPDVHIDCN